MFLSKMTPTWTRDQPSKERIDSRTIAGCEHNLRLHHVLDYWDFVQKRSVPGLRGSRFDIGITSGPRDLYLWE